MRRASSSPVRRKTRPSHSAYSSSRLLALPLEEGIVPDRLRQAIGIDDGARIELDTGSLPVGEILAPGLEVEDRMHGRNRRLLIDAAGRELAAQFLELAQELDVGLADGSLEGWRVRVVEAERQALVWVGEVAEDDGRVTLVPEALGPGGVRKRLDAENTAVALAAAVLIGLRKEPVEFIQAPALLWIERAHQDEEEGRTLDLLAQGLGQRVAGAQHAIVEEDLDGGAGLDGRVESGSKAIPETAGDMLAPVAQHRSACFVLGMRIADEHIVVERLADVGQTAFLPCDSRSVLQVVEPSRPHSAQ